MTHLLDTDTCIGVLRQRPGIVQRLSRLEPADCAVSMVTVFVHDSILCAQQLRTRSGKGHSSQRELERSQKSRTI